MGVLTEVEIFDCLATNFRLAIEACEALAKRPVGGIKYDELRKALRLIEGCCKQGTVWREDTRWLKFGVMMAECHKRAGDWLRGIKMPDGTRVKIADGQLHPAFKMLADNLRGLMALAERTRTMRTNRVGMILPEVLPGPHRDTRPVGFRKTVPPPMSKGGIIIPDGVSLH
jgi:hypothetical protein